MAAVDEKHLLLQFNVNGVTFEDRVKHIGSLRTNDKVKLVAEPTNQYDPKAIRVENLDGELLGYVPKQLTDRIDRTQGETFVVMEVGKYNGRPFLNIQRQNE